MFPYSFPPFPFLVLHVEDFRQECLNLNKNKQKVPLVPRVPSWWAKYNSVVLNCRVIYPSCRSRGPNTANQHLAGFQVVLFLRDWLGGCLLVSFAACGKSTPAQARGRPGPLHYMGAKGGDHRVMRALNDSSHPKAVPIV